MKYKKLNTLLIFVMLLSLLVSCNINNEIISESSEITSEVSTFSSEISTEASAEQSEGGSSEEQSQPNNDLLRISFIDVGQGDCILIKTAEGNNILIDSGSLESKDKVLNYLEFENVDEIEYAFFTHPHADHIGAADEILKSIEIKNVYIPNAVTTTQVYNRMLDELEKHESVVQAKSGQKISFDGIEIDILSPIKDEYNDLNKYSIVMKLTYGKNSFLLTGDATSENEVEMLEKGLDLKADILKIGHHGSNTSTSSEFLTAVAPEVAVISCGVNNRYGHPHQETLEKLKDIDTYRTDQGGTIIVYCSLEDYVIKTER